MNLTIKVKNQAEEFDFIDQNFVVVDYFGVWSSSPSSAVLAGPWNALTARWSVCSIVEGPSTPLGDHDCHGVVMVSQQIFLYSWLSYFYVVDFYKPCVEPLQPGV